ncbi:hypothetical protein MSG28_012071 [Choristoneura fumiferana]|uniref:Uncharacterized protein n=1 Tax=Choristoneura fumiferana TaxID=7141 RepID=A0ACC0KMU8_CHOFU|nr:hypothetical protein MSG28_012071 [Choristoneura fumiferana]
MAKKRGKARSAKAVPVPAPESSDSAAKPPSVTDSMSVEAIAAALSSINQSVLMKVCRLCETKDGPFLNIFDPETLTAKKTQELMPFVIAEYDDLPHKICFRCSAKVEELHEFVQKCIRTQESLRKALGRSGPKTKQSKLWEEKLHKSNISNDDICDALIKKAMAGIEDLPLKAFEEVKPILSKVQKEIDVKNYVEEKQDNDDNDGDDDGDCDSDLPLKQINLERQNSKSSGTTRQEQSKPKTYTNEKKLNEKALLDSLKNKKVVHESDAQKNNSSVIDVQSTSEAEDEIPLQTRSTKRKVIANKTPQNKPQAQTEVAATTNIISSESEDSDTSIKVKQPEQINKEAAKVEISKKEKPFNIMDHVSMIKVNGVGVLFQCKLCNRNFLKREVVISHGCAKNGVPKVDFTKNIAPPDPPKVTTVKYINTKIDGEIRRPVVASVPSPVIPTTTPAPVPNPVQTPSLQLLQPPQPENKSKPRVGPASKIKRNTPAVGMVVKPREPSPEAQPPNVGTMPSVQFPTTPNLKSRYKLVPGPNNTFTLMETFDNQEPAPPAPKLVQKPTTPVETRPKLRPVKSNEVPQQIININLNRHIQSQVKNTDNTEEITPHVSNPPPYPVGLFQTVPRGNNVPPTPVVTQPVPFTTPAMKKQSYTIVKTGNPSKLLISTKPQPPAEEPPKKKTRRSKNETSQETEPTQPFNITLEDTVRQKDGFFTFINVDPLLQPSYVLPTDNIIQESQISTSTPQSSQATAEKDLYSCNMCSEKFTREKKLLAHIQSHYSKMDEEDQIREKTVKKRTRTRRI